MIPNDSFPIKNHKADLCVVGGGPAGLVAAVAAARRGAKVVLMQDRPMVGGNSSSEIRMHVCGAHGKNNRETGIIEEIHLENMARNPAGNWTVWDSVQYEKVRFQDNLTVLLNCSCCDATMDGSRLVSVQGWQTTSQTWHIVEAKNFADCSGDSVLAPLTGAVVRVGRESSKEFNEDIQPEEADRKTMGMSCLIQARETDSAKEFKPPWWAYKYATCDDLPKRGHGVGSTNWWWMELGGEQDSIHDTEIIRDELLKVAYGVWDHVKNHCKQDAANWELDWIGCLPGKRESRRYEGDHIINQNDVRAEGRFDDLVAYGGWSMDDHHPGGMNWPGKPTIFHKAPSPFGIPYRSLYSRNIENLFVAGRNLSATHAALSSSRVMATCAILGQAVGTAAAIAARDSLSPRGVYEQRLAKLQQNLMDDDAYLPWNTREIATLTREAKLTASEGNPEPLRNGVDRPTDATDNAWTVTPGAWAELRFDAPRRVEEARFIFDSNLDRKKKNNPRNYPLDPQFTPTPETLVKDFRIEAQDAAGAWRVIDRVSDSHQRLVRRELKTEAVAIRFVPEATWGAETARVFAWEVK